jgi:hypothetical protein
MSVRLIHTCSRSFIGIVTFVIDEKERQQDNAGPTPIQRAGILLA